MLGRHQGHHAYTIGQRRGLGLATAEPLYVLAKEARSGRVVVGPRQALASERVVLEDARLTAARGGGPGGPLRYRSAAIACRAVERGAGRLELELERPAAAVAPGSLPA